jgi:hypothetical protein
MELIFALVLTVSIPSALGAACYFLCRRLRPAPRHLLVFLTIYALFSICLDAFGLAMFCLLLCAAVSKVGVWAHKKSSHRYESGWESPYDLLLFSTLLSFLAGLALVLVLYFHWGVLFFAPLFLLLYFISLVTSPSMMPFLLWMWNSLELRPGVDEHFRD